MKCFQFRTGPSQWFRAAFSAAAFLLTADLHRAAAADVIADWTFETSAPTTAGPFAPEVALTSGSASGSHAGAAVYSSPVGNGSQHSFSSTLWAVGDYWQFALSTVGYRELTLSFDQLSSNSGPGQFQFSYSSDGSSFTNIGSPYTVSPNASPTGWSQTTAITATTYTFDLRSFSALNNGNTFFRLTDTSTTSASGGTVATGGTDRVDNFIVSGISLPAAGTFLNWGTSGSGGNGTWTTTGTNWFDPSASQNVAFNSSKRAVFSGTSGTVTVTNITANNGIEFDSTGYVLTGGTLNLSGTATVLGGILTTINTILDGVNGLTKEASGTLILGGTNTIQGEIALNGGTVEISSDSNLGAAGNTLRFNGGTLKTTASISMAHSMFGSGTLDIAPGTTLQDTAGFGMTALTLSNSGTLDLEDGSTSVGSLTFSAPGKLTSLGFAIAVTGVNAPNLTGTAIISPAQGLTFTAAGTVTVGSSGTIFIPTAITAQKVTKSGSGTLVLTTPNPSLTQFQISAGSVTFNNRDALGVGQLFFNTGTLNPTIDMSETNAMAIGVSIGGLDTAPSVFSGKDIEFAAASSIFPTAGKQIAVTMNNTATVDGALSISGTQISTGFLVGGTGRLIF
ncbi:MAG: fibronectin-binding autotransporter adhesin, partial [Chthoniobacter sp.]|nr:fibronectin-binding autotransporter adhesin [Chthoniobacter sp.]